MTAVNDIAEKYRMPVIYSCHPRSKKHIERRRFAFHPLVRGDDALWISRLQQAADERLLCPFRFRDTQREESAILGFAGC